MSRRLRYLYPREIGETTRNRIASFADYDRVRYAAHAIARYRRQRFATQRCGSVVLIWRVR